MSGTVRQPQAERADALSGTIIQFQGALMIRPSVLLVPGAWHKPDHFHLLIDELADMDVHNVTLTSSGDNPATLGDMHTDAEVIAQAVAAVGGPVVVVAHSYGGIPATQGLTNARNVRNIIYLASFQLDAGDSLLSQNPEGALLPWAELRHREGIDDFVEVMTPEAVFFNDLDATAVATAVSQIGYQSYSSMRQPLTHTAWKSIPSTYVVCEADAALPVAAQERMALRANDVHRMNTSHSPFLSQPAALARVVRRVLANLE
jgi:pimeloyl-ACP methyl ester carboxylesterase